MILPLVPIPSTWVDGIDLVIEDAREREVDKDLEQWSNEIDALARQIPDEDFDRIDAALAQADREAKESVRRQMVLP